jgi:hypothetical protein
MAAVTRFLQITPPSNTVPVSFSSSLQRVDFAGSLTLIVSIVLLLLSLEHGGNVSWASPYTLFPLLVSLLILFPLFLYIEFAYAHEPLAPKRILLNRTLAASYICNFFAMGCALSTMYQVSLYWQAALHLTAGQAGRWFIVSPVAAMMGSLSAGAIIQATGKYYGLVTSAYGLGLVGSLGISMTSGVVWRSAGGVAAGLLSMIYCFWMLIDGSP